MGIEPTSQRWKRRIMPLYHTRMERMMGIEPTSQAWEVHILPLNHTRIL